MKLPCVTSCLMLLSADNLMTQDGLLHVQQTSGAVLNQDTDQWSIQLTCGLFIFRDSPLFYVEWIVSGHHLNCVFTLFHNTQFKSEVSENELSSTDSSVLPVMNLLSCLTLVVLLVHLCLSAR